MDNNNNNKHINGYMKCTSKKNKKNEYGNMWSLDIYRKHQNFSKEITESMSVISAIKSLLDKKILNLNEERKNCRIFVPGDGKRPYTSSVLSIFFNFKDIYCIDPKLDLTLLKKDQISTLNEKGIHLHNSTIEEFVKYFNNSEDNKYNIVVNVHGHGPINDFYRSLNSPKIFVSLACCSDYGILKERKADFEIVDKYVFSDKNKVFVYIN